VRASAKVPLSWQGYALVSDYGNMRSIFYPLLRFLYRLVGKGGCLRCLWVVWCTICACPLLLACNHHRKDCWGLHFAFGALAFKLLLQDVGAPYGMCSVLVAS
jgi:hypothetical protein